MAGVEVAVTNLAKSFAGTPVFSDVTFTLPAGEISVLLGPSGTGKSVLLKSIIGLYKPQRGSIVVHGTDLVRCSEARLHDIRKRCGVLFQDGALFGSMTLFENVAFPLREHTTKGEAEIAWIVRSTLTAVGLADAGAKLPGQLSGGMRKRAGLARALVLRPEILLVDEPDSGLDPVRTAYLNQLLVDLNAQLGATILVVTHDLGTARSLPDNIGMLFRGRLVAFGPREVLLTSEEPVVRQFLAGRRSGPIGMAEEADGATDEAQPADEADPVVPPQLEPSEGLPERPAVRARKDRVVQALPTLSAPARRAVVASLTDAERRRYRLEEPARPETPADRPVDRSEPLDDGPEPAPLFRKPPPEQPPEQPATGATGTVLLPRVEDTPTTELETPTPEPAGHGGWRRLLGRDAS